MISECAPANPVDYYYAKGQPLFAQTTIQAFQDAGEQITGDTDGGNLQDKKSKP